MFTQLNLWLGVAAGAVAALGVAWLYNTVIDNPSVKREAIAIAEAQAKARTEAAIGEVSDVAQRARAMRRYCIDSGLRYDFTTGKCREN